MARVSTAVARHKRTKRIFKAVKGYYGGRGRLYRSARESIIAAGVDAYDGRKRKKRDYRRLWVTRLTAATKALDFSYSRFINGLKKAGITLNRKILSDLAITDPKTFENLVNTAKGALSAPAK